MTSTRPVQVFLLSVALFLSFKAGAAPLPEVDRKSVGLALAGGGARGLAHIGVIRWLEEHRIPIDYVTGTSMGGLVAGAFATGTSGDEKTPRIFLLFLNWAFGVGSATQSQP